MSLDTRSTHDVPLLFGSDVGIEETGYLFGARVEHPVRNDDGPAIVFRVGGTYNHLEVESPAGDIVAASGHGLGYEVGAGASFRLGGSWRV